MTEGLITADEANRFLQACEELPNLRAGELHRLNVAMPEGTVHAGKPGIF
jgi:2-methylcitrate dehydratase